MFLLGSLISVLFKTTTCINGGLWLSLCCLTGSHYPLQRKECQPDVNSVFIWWPLIGEHFENQISMGIHEVLDPQNSPVRSGEESPGLASVLLKPHLSGVYSPVRIQNNNCMHPLLGGSWPGPRLGHLLGQHFILFFCFAPPDPLNWCYIFWSILEEQNKTM